MVRWRSEERYAAICSCGVAIRGPSFATLGSKRFESEKSLVQGKIYGVCDAKERSGTGT